MPHRACECIHILSDDYIRLNMSLHLALKA